MRCAGKSNSRLRSKGFIARPVTAALRRSPNVSNISVDDVDVLLQFALQQKIDLTVVGPEVVSGGRYRGCFCAKRVEDLWAFQSRGRSLKAVRSLPKNSCSAAISRPPGIRFLMTPPLALTFLQEAQFPLVIKADGIAAGKGVYICADLKAGQNRH